MCSIKSSLRILSISFIFLTLFFVIQSESQQQILQKNRSFTNEDIVPDEIIVKFKENTPYTTKAIIHRQLGSLFKRSIPS